MAKRKLDVHVGNLSEGSSGEKLDAAKISAQTIRGNAKAATAKLLSGPPHLLCTDFDVNTLGEKTPWFMEQPVSQLLEILNHYSYSKKRFNLSFTKLGQIASWCQLLHLLFNDVDYNCWKRSAEARTGLKLKFDYLPAYLNKRRHPNFDAPVYGGIVAYLNLFGMGHCEGCGMYLNFSEKTLEKEDYIIVSPFRQMSTEEATALPDYDDSNLYDVADFSMKPDHLMNLLIIRDKIKTRYCCVNPECKKVLNKSICGFPAAAIPEACNSRSNGRAKHVWADLDNDVVSPPQKTLDARGKVVTMPGKVIKQIFLYCIRCGLLKLQGEEDDSSACEHCGGDEEKKCFCDPCSLCEKMPKKCNCVICDVPTCMKCKAENCGKRCKDDPCVCDTTSSASASESSSEESSSSGF